MGFRHEILTLEISGRGISRKGCVVKNNRVPQLYDNIGFNGFLEFEAPTAMDMKT
jgi:hypothetical protein